MDTPSDEHRQYGSLVQLTSPSSPKQPLPRRIGYSIFKSTRDAEQRSRLAQSWLIALSFVSLGLTTSLIGTGLLDLQLITGTDLEGASAFITGLTSGGMVGSILSGAIFNYINTPLQLFLSLSGLGVVSIIMPYCSIYGVMVFVHAICGVFHGLIFTSGNTWHMKMWGSEGKALMQIIQFSFAFGGVLATLYTEPFLAKRFMGNETDIGNITTGNSSELYIACGPPTTNVHYAFIASGVFIILSSIPFAVLYIRQRLPEKQNEIEKQNVNINLTYRELPCCLYLFILSSVSTLLTLQICVELVLSSFLMPFLITEYDSMTKSESVYINTVYWASFAVSRFIMIFVIRLLSSVQLLSLCLLLMSIGCIGFFISAVFEAIPAITVFTAVAGLGMSGVFAGGFSWTANELLKITPRVSSSISTTACTVRICIPLVVGFLMDDVSNMWFCYILLGLTGLLCLLFISLLLFNRRFINKMYGSLTLMEQNSEVDSEHESSVGFVKDEYDTHIRTT